MSYDHTGCEEYVLWLLCHVQVSMQAPAEVMAATLTHLDSRYGGASRYLQSVGFTKEQQQRLAQAVGAIPDHQYVLT